MIDTDILSIFAKADALGVLCRLLQCHKLPITPGVLDELLVPLDYGYDFPRDILSRADVIAMTTEELADYESLRLQGRLSATDAEMISICKQREWLYITMDKVALREAKAAGADTADLRVLLEGIKRAKFFDRERLRALIERMEREDRTRLPYKAALLGSEETERGEEK